VTIQLLPDHLVNKIAAGEVVDRPASVVKELIENSIDAGATNITVHIEGGGRSLIEVHDNGCGLNRSDALMAFERHATSKLKCEEDLFSLVSRGFRGEALPSIASIAKVSLKTNNCADGVGLNVQIEGGKILGVTPVARSLGTSIQVRSLFYNTPVRRKFLRSEEYEGAKVKQTLRRIALAEPLISFELIERGKTALFLPAPATFLDRASSLLNGVTGRCQYEAAGVKVDGVIGHPAQATSSLESLVIYVNRRPVTDKLISRAIRDGFESTLKAKEFPLGVLAIEVDPSMVDVNVHPQKSEVRFVRPQDVFEAVKRAVNDAFLTFRSPLPHDWNLKVSPAPYEYYSVENRSSDVRVAEERQVRDDFNATGTLLSSSLHLPTQTYRASTGESRASDAPTGEGSWPDADFGSAGNGGVTVTGSSAAVLQLYPDESFLYRSLRYLGQVSACYLLFEGSGGALVIMDMHAAHERVNYARLMAKIDQMDGLKSQPLLVPYLVELGEEALSALSERLKEIEAFGFKVRLASDSAVELLNEPILPFARPHLRRSEIRAFFEDIARSDWGSNIGSLFRERLAAILARVACHASIRGGDQIEPAEASALCTELDLIYTSNACPHGRPVVVSFSTLAMEKWFGRDN
jgi:DNA mismatch repair protein MutL